LGLQKYKLFFKNQLLCKKINQKNTTNKESCFSTKRIVCQFAVFQTKGYFLLTI